MNANTHFPLLLHGDCLEILPTLLPRTVDVVLTDPPAGIGFMGKPWDSFKTYEPRTERGHEVLNGLDLLGNLPRWASGFTTFLVEVWTATDRVMKPGAFCCAWALPKTADLAGLAMRLVGWEVHESVLHLFGGGMNKAGDIGKQIDKMHGAEREVVGPHPYADRGVGSSAGVNLHASAERSQDITAPATDDAKRWTGWHSQIAPGHEQWLIGRKPTKLTYARQLLEHGTGAFNVDACRVPRGEADAKANARDAKPSMLGQMNDDGWEPIPTDYRQHPSGSHPRNVVLSTGGDGCPARGLDRQSGELTNGGQKQTLGGRRSRATLEGGALAERPTMMAGDSGGASRYFTRFDQRVGYFPKASDRRVPGRPDLTNKHPTHKHPDLMRWLVRLMAATAEHTGDAPAVVLDPFMSTLR